VSEVSERLSYMSKIFDPVAYGTSSSQKTTNLGMRCAWWPSPNFAHFGLFQNPSFISTLFSHNCYLRYAKVEFLGQYHSTCMFEAVEDTISIETMFPNKFANPWIVSYYFT
jgi:hypothetical protein